jgi:ubiquinone/menaquinone biosynthesis C-methylase UbiE
MSESLRAETGTKAIDLGCGQGDSLKRWRAAGADIVYMGGNPDILLRGIERGNIPGGSAILCRLGNCHFPFFDSLHDVAVL